MEIVPTNQATLVVQATAAATTVSRDERHNDLQLHQMIRATVEEGGQDKALLQFGDKRLWVDTGSPLKAGDTLNLQVVETEPTLAFKIIEPTILQRLGQSLYLLEDQLDVLKLLPAMIEGREPGSKKLATEVRDALERLFTLMKKAPEQLSGRDLGSLPRQLGLFQEADLAAGELHLAQTTLKNALSEIETGHIRRYGELTAHLEPLFGTIARLPELLQTPLPEPAVLKSLPPALAAVLRPLLRLAQSLPESGPAGPPTPAEATLATATDVATPDRQAPVRALVRALVHYLEPTEKVTPQRLNRLEQELSPLPQLLREQMATVSTVPGPTINRTQPTDLLGQLVRLLNTTPEPQATATQAIPAATEPLAQQLATALRKAVALPEAAPAAMEEPVNEPAPPPISGKTSVPTAPTASSPASTPTISEPALTKLTQVLAEIPTVIRQTGQVGPFLESQPTPLTAVLRPLLQLAAMAQEPPAAEPLRPEAATAPGGPAVQNDFSPPPQSPGPATPPAGLSRQAIDLLATEFAHGVGEYLQPFAEITGESLERIEQQAALLQLVYQGPYDQALAAIGQKPAGKDLLGALYHLLRTPPDRLPEGQGQALSQQLIDSLKKIVEQENGRIEERQEDSRRHLELWQLCRARLGDTDTSFVPLPLPFLDNGFMVAHRQSSPETETGAPEEILSLSLYLDLRKLGPLQVDLLYQKEELFVRFKCVDQTVADFVSAASGELGESLGNIRVSAVAVTTGAESPDRALIQKLIPREKGILDARV